VVVVRRAVLLVGALGLAGCDPEIGSGTYYCGPELACPDHLRCDQASAMCVFPEQVGAFECGDNGNAHEPDDVAADGFDLGEAGCDGLEVRLPGCIDNEEDVDFLVGVTQSTCPLATMRVQLRAPLAFMPLSFDLLDGDGAVVASSEVCSFVDDDGEQLSCLEVDMEGGTAYQLRVQRADGGDCGGACGYNRYDLSIF
jgi:hypothetical protein